MAWKFLFGMSMKNEESANDAWKIETTTKTIIRTLIRTGEVLTTKEDPSSGMNAWLTISF